LDGDSEFNDPGGAGRVGESLFAADDLLFAADGGLGAGGFGHGSAGLGES
jgi:hypothetical protein